MANMRVPVDEAEYVSVHGARPMGIRRWRFVCVPADGKTIILDADGEYTSIVPRVQERALREIGNCTATTMATSGPPTPTGERLENPPDDWQIGQVRTVTR